MDKITGSYKGKGGQTNHYSNLKKSHSVGGKQSFRIDAILFNCTTQYLTIFVICNKLYFFLVAGVVPSSISFTFEVACSVPLISFWSSALKVQH